MGEKQIDTLVSDIYELFDGKERELKQEIFDSLGKEVAFTLKERLTATERKPTLRMSSIGKPDRQLWYEINKPEFAEKMLPKTYLKFFLGDLYESVILALAELAGHKVEGRQDEVTVAGIKGHRDAVIDGTTVDVKTASPYSFEKFKTHLTHEQDAFGYLQQIQSYIEAGQDDPIVTVKDKGAFLVGQKVTGDIVLDIHEKTKVPIDIIFEHKKKMVKQPEPPDRCYEPVPMGKSGNEKLGINCSYCAYKFHCWDGLRGFAYSNGPVYLTKVVEEPRVPEIKGVDTDKEEDI